MEDITGISSNQRNIFSSLRWILGLLITSLCIMQLCLTYRGLNQAEAMDMAQIARQIARGEGFSSKFIRPIDAWDYSLAADKKKDVEGATKLDFDKFPDANHAPLYPYVLAAAIKLTGYDDFAANRMDVEKTNIYAGDRIISGTSTLFFIVAMVLAYTLLTRMFDEVVAATTVAFMGLSELMLQYALSGLPHTLMMCFLLAAAHCLLSAIKADQHVNTQKTIIWVCAAFVFISLLCLTNYMCIWIALGLLVFCGIFFRPYGMYAAIGAGILAFLVLLPTAIILAPAGGIERQIIHGVFNGFGSSGAETLMRTASTSAIAFNSANFFFSATGSFSSTPYFFAIASAFFFLAVAFR